MKRDIFWASSNITSGDRNFCELVAKSGLLALALQSIVSDNDIVINEALFMLSAFFDRQNIETIINYSHLDYIRNLILCLKNIHNKSSPGDENKMIMKIVEEILTCIAYLFEDGNLLRSEGYPNKFVKDFEKNGGFELLEIMLSEKNLSQDVEKIAEALLNEQNNNV